MERDFKKEFIELKQSEVPDLWDRIEAGLAPKTTTSSEHTSVKQNTLQNVEMKTEQIAEPKPDVSFEQSDIRQKILQDTTYQEKKSGYNVRIYRWGLLAAACLCLLIILPVLSLTRSNSFSPDMSGAGAPASEGMEADAADAGFDMTAEAASEPAENGGSEMQSAESIESEIQDSESSMNGYTNSFAGADAESDRTDAMEDSVSNSVMNSAEASRSEAASAADRASDDSNMSKNEMKELQAGKAADWNDILQEGQMLHEVKIKVSEMVQSDSVNQTYTVRAVVVSPDEDGYLYEGAELTLLCNEETIYEFVSKPRRGIPLQTGEIYVVDLQYEGKGDFVAVKIY